MIEGGCACGAVRYTIDRADLPLAYACHCHQCQRATGSAFAVQAMAGEAALTVTGPVATRSVATADRVSTQRFCAECHARLYSTSSVRPGLALVRGGTLDRSEELGVRAHIFAAYRQAWVALPAGVPSWPERPPPDAFMTAMLAAG